MKYSISIKWSRPEENEIFKCEDLNEDELLARIRNVLRQHEHVKIYDLNVKKLKK